MGRRPTVTDVVRALKAGEGVKSDILGGISLRGNLMFVNRNGTVSSFWGRIERSPIDRWRIRRALKAWHKIKKDTDQ